AGSTVVTQGYGTPNAISTTYTLDGSGRATVVTDGLGHTNKFGYDADNDITSSQDGNNNTTSYTYQYVGPPGTGGIASTGQVTQVVRPAINPLYPTNTATHPTTNYAYNPSTHDLTEQYDNNGAYSFYTYDASHGLVSMAVL